MRGAHNSSRRLGPTGRHQQLARRSWRPLAPVAIIALAACSVCAVASAQPQVGPKPSIPNSGVEAPTVTARSEAFKFTGSPQTVVVPTGYNAAEVTVIGARGGSAQACVESGGDGARVTGRIPVTPGEVLTATVGGAGGTGVNGLSHPGGGGGWGATAYGGTGGSAGQGGAGGGGGATGLAIGGLNVIVAGGGGGAGSGGFLCGFDNGGDGGSGGRTPGDGKSGIGSGAGHGGKGGGMTGSGRGGNGADGHHAGGGGGGGGGGYGGGDSGGGNGGAGGSTGGGGGGGGGGGSSLITSRVELARIASGHTGDGNGLITVTWEDTAAPKCPDQSVDVFHDARTAFKLSCPGGIEPGSFQVLAQPSHGHLENDDLITGTFTYVPDAGYAGTDTMKFLARAAGRASNQATVTFVVARECLDQTVHALAGSPGVEVRLHCSRGADQAEFKLDTIPGRAPAHGDLKDIDTTDGTFTYVPSRSYSGSDSLTFESVSHGFASRPATITFILGSQHWATCPDHTYPDVPHNGVHVELRCPELADSVTYRIVALPEHGHLEHEDLTSGTLTYIPDDSYHGPDSIMFQAFHGGNASGEATINFTVARPVPPMVLTAAPDDVAFGSAPILTATLPQTIDHGSVGFYDDQIPGSDKGIGTAEIHDGVAKLTAPTRTLPEGTNSIHASYDGNDDWAPNDSNVVTVTVSAPD